MNVKLDPETIVSHFIDLQHQVFEFSLQLGKSNGEKESIDKFLRSSSDISSFLVDHKQDLKALFDVEKDLIRPLAVNLREYSLRHHLTCCRPFWGSQSITYPNKFVTFGSYQFEALLTEYAETLSLSNSNKQGSGTSNRIRWDSICKSNFAVFEFNHKSRKQGKTASICHALGISLATGTMPVIIKDEEPMPFDVHIEPIIVPFQDATETIILEALSKAAVAQFQIEEQESSIDKTISFALDQFSDTAAGRYIQAPLIELQESNPLDPITVSLYLKSLLGRSGGSNYELLTPLWPGGYPNKEQQSCFHVLPFSLSDDISRAVERGCTPNVIYKRGDKTGDIDVIRGIWDEICRANYVVVDLTPANINGNPDDVYPNPNVCLELALAQVLGRKLLLIRDEAAASAPLFPEIAKLQILHYDTPKKLTTYVEHFINQDYFV